MEKETAIDWLKDKIKETYEKEKKLPLGYILYLINEAKKIEKEQNKNLTGEQQ